MLTAVVGVNWGDEGKGRMVDLLAENCDVVCRYQGGNNAGHTVVNHLGKFILNLVPCGIFHGHVTNVMGGGMVIDLEHLCGEIEGLRAKGIAISPENLRISDKAFVCMPYHKMQDILEEDRLGDKKYGSTRRGIAPVYGDKYMKKGIRVGDLLQPDTLEEKLKDILDWKNLTLGAYGAKAEVAEMLAWLKKYGVPLLPYVTDTTEFLEDAAAAGKRVLFEAQLGTLRDLDYGIYPYTTSSNTLAAYGPIGAGVPGLRLDRVVGVMKAFSSCVGAGPFAVEMFGAEGDALRGAGEEFGAATGRPRRVGGFDAVASRYGIHMQGIDELALTKLDVLSYMDKIPVCVAYETGGERTGRFPSGDRLMEAKPVFEYLDGWKTDISRCRRREELPPAALAYIAFIEKAVGRPVTYVSVGPARDDYLVMG